MTASHRPISGTVIAITGASSGIGAAAACQLVEAGARVVLQARRAERLGGLVTALGADHAVAVPGDVQDPAAAELLVQGAIEAFGQLDSIVINAGIGHYGGILDGTDAEVQLMLRTNVEGTVWAVRAAVARFRKAGVGGDVVIIGSVAGMRGGGNEAVYAATKSAQLGLAGSLDREVRTEGIRVSCIMPAAVNTEFAIGRGRTAGDPQLEEFLQPADVGAAVLTVLRQPRRLRTTQWAMWSMSEAS